MAKKKKADKQNEDSFNFKYYKDVKKDQYFRVSSYNYVTVLDFSNNSNLRFGVFYHENWYSSAASWVEEIPKETYDQKQREAICFIETNSPF